MQLKQWRMTNVATSEQVQGYRNGMARLTEEDVRLIRELKKQSDLSNAEIARKFEVGSSTVSDIINGHTWRNV